MNAQTTNRNTEIVKAYIAGNHNKTELARYFGVSASTIRRVLATVAMMAFTVVASVPAVAADSDSQSFLNQVYELGTNNPKVLNSWENLSYDEQQDVFTANPSLRQELKAPVKTPAHTPETEVDPVEQTITPPEVKIVLPDSTIEQTQPDHVTQTTSTLVQQQVRSAYYDKQITALNAEAEQNHADVLSESHARFQADKQVLSESESYTNQKFSDLKSQVDDNKKEAAAGSASAMAQANIPQVQESQQFAVGAGIGGYDSENALSVGASFHAGQATIVKMSVSDDSQSNVGYGAGVSVGW